MDIFVPILTHATKIVLENSDNIVSIANRVTKMIWQIFSTLENKQNEEAILTILRDIGCNSDAEIRQKVFVFCQKSNLSDQVAEEIAKIFINLAHSTRFMTTQGITSSRVILHMDTIKKIVEFLQTARKIGEKVHSNSSWKLDQFLGKGDFGEVWRGANENYPYPRAFKFFTQAESRQWLHQEAQTLARVQEVFQDHPNIVRYENIETDTQPYPYIELEYVNGGSLENWLLNRLPSRVEVNKYIVLEDIIQAISHAHENEIYHGDLKPANILLQVKEYGAQIEVRAKITDFGLGSFKPKEVTPAPANR